MAPHVPLLLALAACAADDPTPLDLTIDPSFEAPASPLITCYGPLPAGTAGCSTSDEATLSASMTAEDTIRIVESPAYGGWAIVLTLHDDRGAACLAYYSDDDTHEPDRCAHAGAIRISSPTPPMAVLLQAAFPDDAQLSARFTVDP